MFELYHFFFHLQNYKTVIKIFLSFKNLSTIYFTFFFNNLLNNISENKIKSITRWISNVITAPLEQVQHVPRERRSRRGRTRGTRCTSACTHTTMFTHRAIAISIPERSGNQRASPDWTWWLTPSWYWIWTQGETVVQVCNWSRYGERMTTNIYLFENHLLCVSIHKFLYFFFPFSLSNLVNTLLYINYLFIIEYLMLVFY